MGVTPEDLRVLKEKTANLCEAVIVCAQEARRVNEDNKTEFSNLISTFAPASDDDFDERDNQEQEKISLEFEKRNKPHIVAIKKMVDDKIDYRFKNTEE